MVKAMKSYVRKTSRRCTCCGKLGHTVTTCRATGAQQIRKLLSQLASRTGQRKRKARVGVKKWGAGKAAARREYTPNPVAGEASGKLNRMKDQSAWGQKGRRATFLKCDAVSPVCALQQLIDLECVKLPKTCPLCNGNLSAPCLKNKNHPHNLYVRCTSYACHRFFNVMQFTVFWPTTLTVSQTLILLKKYARPDSIAPPAAHKLCVDAGCGKAQAQNFVKLCRGAEARQGQKLNKVGSIGGDVEVDVHQVAKVYVSPKNPVYKHLIQEKYRDAKYYLLYIRVAGVLQRGCGKLYLAFLPFHQLLPPKSRPPPESYLEVEQCDILHKVRPKANVHIDGNKSWPKLTKEVYKKKGFKVPSVSHKTNQFTKPIRKRTLKHKGRKLSLARLSGTQAIDRTWKELDRSIPHTLRKKMPIKDSVHNEVNSDLFDRVWSWLYRFNRRHNGVDACQVTKSLVELLQSDRT